MEKVKASVDKQMDWDSFGLPLTLEVAAILGNPLSVSSRLPGMQSISLHQRLDKTPVTSGLETPSLPYSTYTQSSVSAWKMDVSPVPAPPLPLNALLK